MKAIAPDDAPIKIISTTSAIGSLLSDFSFSSDSLIVLHICDTASIPVRHPKIPIAMQPNTSAIFDLYCFYININNAVAELWFAYHGQVKHWGGSTPALN